MGLDKSKLFVGGISPETSEEVLRVHFGRYGDVSEVLVCKNRITRGPRGFGFVTFSDPAAAEKALRDKHVIRERVVEVQKAIPRGEHLQPQQQLSKLGKNGKSNDRKIFVGGLGSTLTEEEFKNYFERFGRVTDVVVMQDSSTNRPRGFGFITFDSEDSVDKAVSESFQDLNGRHVEVKRAIPRNEYNSNYSRTGAAMGSSNMNPYPEGYPPSGPGFEILPSHAPFPAYTGAGGYFYGPGVCGTGYPMVACSRPGFMVTHIAPSITWSGPVMIGTGACPFPHTNACLYPGYLDNGISIVGMGNGTVGPGVNGKQNQFLGENWFLQPDTMVPPIQGAMSGVDTSGLEGSDRGLIV